MSNALFTSVTVRKKLCVATSPTWVNMSLLQERGRGNKHYIIQRFPPSRGSAIRLLSYGKVQAAGSPLHQGPREGWTANGGQSVQPFFAC